MSTYPFAIDDDSTIIRIDDNIQELGDQSINQLREAVFAIETELGINPSGSLSSVADRLDVALNPNGTIKSSALTSVGLASLPITDVQVGTNAAIAEHKLALAFTTTDLNSAIAVNTAQINALTAFTNETDSDLNTHVAGGSLLGDGSPARHVASHIDLNAVPSDARDSSFAWSGLLDKDGNQRIATNVANGLQQVNDALTSHENLAISAHPATSIDVDTSSFEEIPQTIDTVQKFADWVDDFNNMTLGEHRATQHDNAIPKVARSQDLSLPDGYRENVVPATPVQTYLVRSPNTSPVDDIAIGDNLIRFVPTNNSFTFDEVFGRVMVGDEIRINYANGVEVKFYIDSIRFNPGSEWVVRINGNNLYDNDGYAMARIDRAQYDPNVSGVLALAPANATPTGSFDTILSSVIVGSPRGATAIGVGFDPGQLDANHYNLYMEMYPTGNPEDRVITMPAIDVTGNAGTTPGQYTLDSVIQATNQKLREIGYNLRMIAYAHEGEFAIMLADVINNASFSIIKGINSSGALATGAFTNNVIGEASDNQDALGLGASKGDIAGVSFINSFVDGFAAQINTKVIPPLRRRHYIVNGRVRDTFANTWMANDSGYWDGYISARTEVGAFTVETTYTVFLDLEAAGLKPGKTIVVQPVVDFDDGTYFDVDYGRFIIKDVNFVPPCPGDPPTTLITVINGVHATGNGFTFSSPPEQPVRLYFGEDSVGFNNEQLRSTTPTAQDYRRHHEIFIDEEGRTFAHERARMPIQSQTGTLLNTDGFHIVDVSPKLRGYRDDATSFEKFLRFYVLSYDTNTGEYDGYLGQRVPSSTQITKVGSVVTGRKDTVTRFYDETNIDYIDLIFDEEALTLATESLILTDGTPGGGGIPRYVDIEIFDGLRSHDEILLLGTCEVNWDPDSGQAIVQRVINRRQFGSIAEDDFTPSAIAYINAGDRLLHENGVLRGLDFESIGVDNREVSFAGGVALVNGTKVFVNASTVTIPEISENLAGTPDTIDWAVCVNQNGNLVPILVTPNKQQFFAIENTGGATFYVPSVTFAELVEARKDLTPIYTLSATIASFTLSSADVRDVRRFIGDAGRMRDLVVAADGYVGNFNSFDAVINYINSYNSDSVIKVKVRGEFTFDTAITLTNTSPVIFEGDGAIINVRSLNGFVITDNVTFRNVTFNYNPDVTGVTFTTGDKAYHANGCLYSQGDRSNVTVEECIFNSAITTQRPSFISFEFDRGEVVSNIRIAKNTFSDSGGSDPVTGGTDDPSAQGAISIVHLASEASAAPAVLYNVAIKDNKCSAFQGIYLLQEGLDQASSALSIVGPGIIMNDVTVSGNRCGIIGFFNTSEEATSGIGKDVDAIEGITIERNTCIMIAHMANHGGSNVVTFPGTLAIQTTTIATSPIYATGSASIARNNCAIIAIICGEDASSNEYSRVNINNNIIRPQNDSLIEIWSRTNHLTSSSEQNYGIVVGAGQSTSDPAEVIIANNIVVQGLYDGTAYAVRTGIGCYVSGQIIGNKISRFTVTGIDTLGSPSHTRRYVVTENDLFRDTSISITQYIFLDTSDTAASGICSNNHFNSPFIDSGGTDDETINGTGTGSPASPYGDLWVVENNKNQTSLINLSPADGTFSMNDVVMGAPSFIVDSTISIGPSALETTRDNTVYHTLADSSLQISFFWDISGKAHLPANVYVISASVDYAMSSTAPGTTNDLSILISQDPSGTLPPADEEVTPINPAGSSSGTVTLTPTGTFFNKPANRLAIRILWVANRGASGTASNLTLSDAQVAVRW